MKVVAFVLALPFLAIFLVAFALFLGVVWLFGVPIKVSQEGKTIGHIRWFKYTPVKEK